MVAIRQSDLSAAQCARVLDYDARTGVLTWATRAARACRVGAEAGFLHVGDGYRYVNLRYRMRLAHRLVWLMTYGEWPELYIDHINRDRSDNRIVNLRLATPTESSRNTSPRPGTSSRFLGVTRLGKGWQAGIRLPGRGSVYLGVWATEEEAAEAYARAAKEHFGEFVGKAGT